MNPLHEYIVSFMLCKTDLKTKIWIQSKLCIDCIQIADLRQIWKSIRKLVMMKRRRSVGDQCDELGEQSWWDVEEIHMVWYDLMKSRCTIKRNPNRMPRMMKCQSIEVAIRRKYRLSCYPIRERLWPKLLRFSSQGRRAIHLSGGGLTAHRINLNKAWQYQA